VTDELKMVNQDAVVAYYRYHTSIHALF